MQDDSHSYDPVLLSAARAWTAERQTRLGIASGSPQDVARQLLRRGVMEVDGAGGIRARAGDTPEAIVERMREDPACRHYFIAKSAATAAPKANLKAMNARDRLEWANANETPRGRK